MKEHYVTYQQAVKLKELGFDWPTSHYYCAFDDETDVRLWDIHPKQSQNAFRTLKNTVIADAPRLDQAQSWLREEKRIHVEPYFVYETRFDLYIKSQDYSVFKREEQCFDTYELALSAGIDKALELLKEK